MSIALLNLLLSIISLLTIIIFAWVIVSWLLAFNIINTRNTVVYQIVRALNGIIDPLVAPIRKVVPSLGGLDFSPVILLLGLMFLRDWIVQIARGNLL